MSPSRSASDPAGGARTGRPNGPRRTRGILHPARLPTLTRLDAPTNVAGFVRWFWIPEWDLEPGRTSRQQIIAFPACNLVVEGHEVTLAGPTTRVTHRDLDGRGWAVGALLRPAAVAALTPDPARLGDRTETLRLPELAAAVTNVWLDHAATGDGGDGGDGTSRHRAAVAAFAEWLRRTLPVPGDDARLANRFVDLVEEDLSVIRPEQAARILGVSLRTLQRIAHRHIGLGPAELLRRRRLQAAAEAVRTRPDADLATIAAELGYADHAHLTREFRDRLGFTPSSYRGDTTDEGRSRP